MSLRDPRREDSPVREKQAELRARYLERPEEAKTIKGARTSSVEVPATDPHHGEVEIGNEHGIRLRYGLDQSVGGLHDMPNPGDLLCAALAACEDGTLRMAAALLGVELEALEVDVQGSVDVRGTLGVDAGARVGFESLRCRIELRPVPGSDPRMVRALLSAAERFCINLDTLRNGIAVEVAEGAPSSDGAR